MAHILIAEDERDIRELIKFTLTFAGHQISEATNGEEVVAKALELIPDLIMTDVRMPKMDGFDLVFDIKKKNYDFPIIIITALKSIEKKRQMLRLGIDNYLYKPFFKEELVNTFRYPTRNNGMHFWLRYTGTDSLANKTSGLGIDLRCAHPITGKSLGYVVYYPRDDFRTHLNKINETSEEMNEWIESLFSRKSKLRK